VQPASKLSNKIKTTPTTPLGGIFEEHGEHEMKMRENPSEAVEKERHLKNDSPCISHLMKGRDLRMDVCVMAEIVLPAASDVVFGRSETQRCIHIYMYL